MEILNHKGEKICDFDDLLSTEDCPDFDWKARDFDKYFSGFVWVKSRGRLINHCNSAVRPIIF